MVRCLYGDDIRAEVWPKQQAQSLDGVRLLGLASREAELGELLVRLQHHHVWSKHHTSLLLFVVIDLNGSVVGDTEGHDPCLVTLGSRSGTRATCTIRYSKLIVHIIVA